MLYKTHKHKNLTQKQKEKLISRAGKKREKPAGYKPPMYQDIRYFPLNG